MTVKSPYKRAPRVKIRVTTYVVDDVVQVGSTRWIIRSLRGVDVVLEAANVSPGIRWATTLDRLPEKVTQL